MNNLYTFKNIWSIPIIMFLFTSGISLGFKIEGFLAGSSIMFILSVVVLFSFRLCMLSFIARELEYMNDRQTKDTLGITQISLIRSARGYYIYTEGKRASKFFFLRKNFQEYLKKLENS